MVSAKHFMMSIYNYFKKTKPSEVLCSVIEEEKDSAVKTIDLTGCEAKNVKSQLEKAEAQGSGIRKRYIKWRPELRAEIGKRAHKYRIASVLKHFAGVYPNLKKQTVFEFKKSYKKLKPMHVNVTKIHSNKRGRPKILPEHLMEKTTDTVKSLQLKGAPISRSVINAIAKGIVITNDRMQFVENGGHLSFSDVWARNILNEMDRRGKRIKRRMATTCKIPVAPALLEEEKFTFQRNIEREVDSHNIPEELILKFDQTPLSYVCTSNTTLEVQGKKSVSVVGKGKQKQITGTFTVLPRRILCHSYPQMIGAAKNLRLNIWRKWCSLICQRRVSILNYRMIKKLSLY